MQAMLRAFPLLVLLGLGIPVLADDAVEKAIQAAREQATQPEAEEKPAEELTRVEPPAETEKQPQESAEAQKQPQESKEVESGIEQASYPGVKNLHIQRGGNGLPSISIYYPSVGNKEIDETLKKFVEDIADSYEKDVTEIGADPEDRPSSYGSWEETGFFTISYPNPNVISITFNIYYYTGGAHGQLLINVQNYDLKTGQELKLEDLFADPKEALDIMSRLSASKLREALGPDTEEEMLVSGTAPEPDNFLNLSLHPSGIIVEFQPYQVGPWAIGQQHVDLSLADLTAAGPNPAIWPDTRK